MMMMMMMIVDRVTTQAPDGSSTRKATLRSTAELAGEETADSSKTPTDGDVQHHSPARRTQDLDLSQASTTAWRYQFTASRNIDVLCRSQSRPRGRTPADRSVFSRYIMTVQEHYCLSFLA